MKHDSRLLLLRSLIIVFIAVSIAWSATNIIDFDNGNNEYTTGSIASISGGNAIEGSSLVADTRNAAGTWIQFFASKPGLFKPNTEYTVIFDYKNIDLPPDSYLHCVIRDPSIGDSSTLKSINLPDDTGLKTRKFTVRIPDNTSYSLIFFMHKKGLVSIDNIRIVEGGFVVKRTAKPDTQKVQEDAMPPQGPKMFSIDAPLKKNGPVLSAADFGADPANPNNFEAFQRAAAACRERNAASLVIPKGRYYLESMEDTLQFANLSNFTLDGQGSELIFFRPRLKWGWPFFYITNCHRAQFLNIAIDWNWEKMPLASVVTVTATGSNGDYIDCRFTEHERFPAPDAMPRDLQALDPKTMTVGFEGSSDISECFQEKMEWLSPNTARVRLDPKSKSYGYGRFLLQKKVVPGMYFRMRHFNYDMGGLRIYDSTQITLSNAAVYSSPGMGIFISGDTHHIAFKNVRIAPKPGASNRCISTTADHFHANNSQGYLLFDGCDFGFGGDDCINIHDNNFYGTRTGERSFLGKHFRMWATPIHEGDTIEFRNEDLSPAGVQAVIRSFSYDAKKEECSIEFDRPVPDGKLLVCFNRRYGSHNYIIRNSYFHDNRAAGFRLQADNGLAENNRFYHNQMPAIRIETGYSLTSWCEGYGLTNLVIRGNTFDSCNTVGNEEHGPVIHMSVFRKDTSSPDNKSPYPIFSDLLVESNRFINAAGTLMTVSSAGNVTIRNNKIYGEQARMQTNAKRSAVYASYTTNISVINNVWQASPYVPAPGLIYESDTIYGIRFDGNTVKQD
ncbi:MAG: right-handed parallel beta-helix repeat-containing protein [Spirochaetes bacterium]|nr:right-handed parallel beta-helix repeat-containing protein [Spirochaetota bacterium]